MTEAGPPNIGQEKDRPRVAPQNNPPLVAQEKDRPRVAPQNNPPQVAQEKDRPQPVDEAKGDGQEIDPSYTHFAIDKSTGKIVEGWEYDNEIDNESIKHYCKIDLEDMFSDRKISEFKILTGKSLLKQGVDPFDWRSNWQHVNYDESIGESTKYGHNGVDPFMNIGKDGSFNESADEVIELFRQLSEGAGMAHAAGFAETPMGGGFSRPKKGIGELSPKTYDRVNLAGRERNDNKGDRVADLAMRQKGKLYAGQYITYTDAMNSTITAGIKNIHTGEGYLNVITDKDQEGVGLKVLVIQGKPTVRNLYNDTVSVDRKTANLLASILNKEEGLSLKANDFKQM